MRKAEYEKYMLHFKEAAGTSRGTLVEKETYIIRIWDDAQPEIKGTGECALFRGLSKEDCPEYEARLSELCRNIDRVSPEHLVEWSSLRFGVEMALADLHHGGKGIYFPSAFTAGQQAIEINGLIWMGDRTTMLQRIEQKLVAGFRCIKLKIGAIDFESELSLLKHIRTRFDRTQVELRVDANGAFSPEDALEKLEALSEFDLHSIEQPVKAGQWEVMADLCVHSPVPVALDEELIGVTRMEDKRSLVSAIHPQYLVLKPALCGGFAGACDWISLAQRAGIQWWVTSALESNIGLNALAQWVATLNNPMPQGLGTGQLYTNNFPSPVVQEGSVLLYR